MRKADLDAAAMDEDEDLTGFNVHQNNVSSKEAAFMAMASEIRGHLEQPFRHLFHVLTYMSSAHVM